MKEGETSVLTRHADKGKWTINEEELRQRLSQNEANLVMAVLQAEFSDWKETPLKLDGLVRSLRLGDKLFDNLPQSGILVITDSGKERAQLTRTLVAARIAQLETQDQNRRGIEAKRIDMLHVDAKEITSMLADSSDKTWAFYAEMIEKEGISESEAIAQWLNDMNQPDVNVPENIHPKESADRYRSLVKVLRSRITSNQAPIILFGVGHSGSLGQIRQESLVRPLTAQDSPEFCEMFKFDEHGNLVDSERIEI